MGKTWKDDKVISRHKSGGREMTRDMDLHTRVKPIHKKAKKYSGKNLVKDLDSFLEENYDDKFENEDY